MIPVTATEIEQLIYLLDTRDSKNENLMLFIILEALAEWLRGQRGE